MRFLMPFLILLGGCSTSDMPSPSVPSTWVATAHAAPLPGHPQPIADVAEATVRSVVHIASKRTVNASVPRDLRFFMPEGMGPQVQRGAGSGVLVGRGLVLTNNHVIDGASELQVTLSDGRTFDGVVKGADPGTDLAIVELQGEVPADLPVMAFGDSDALRLGEVVLAIGSPFELQGSVTMGIVSARGRQMGLARYEDFIQTDAAINPGNSGGALVSLEGDLVGINTAIGSRSGGYDGIGFAIPSNLAQDILRRLLADGKVVRGYLGVMPTDVDARAAASLGLETPSGALITEVTPGSAADRAGLRTYDVVTAVDGEPIANAAALRNVIAMKGADAKVQLDVQREGRRKQLKAVLGTLEDGSAQAPGAPSEVAEEPIAGVRLMPLDDRIRAQLRLSDPTVSGAVVAAVQPSSSAADAGLQRGDIIVEVDRRPTPTPADVRAALGGDGPWMVRVRRGGVHTVVFLER